MADDTAKALAVFVEQAGGAMLPADPQGRYLHRFEIAGSVDRRTGRARLYVIAYDTAAQHWCCGCRGWIAHRRCKHLQAMHGGLMRIGHAKPAAAPPALPGPSR